MSDQSRSFVDANYGNLHTGVGDQYIFVQHAQATGQDPRHIAAEQMACLRDLFVPPDEFSRALHTIQAQRAVLLEGAQGSGRRTTAWMLLDELSSGSGAFLEIVPEKSGRRLDPGNVSQGSLVLVDLAGITDEWPVLLGELPDLIRVIHEQSAYLVVVLPTRMSERPSAEVGACVRISRPSSLRVLRHHLRVGGIPVSETASTPEGLSTFLARTPSMEKVAYLATLIVEARDQSETEGGFALWCERALDVLTDSQHASTTNNLAALSEGPQRALLLATSMLHGSHIDAIHQAADAILKTLRHPQDTRPLLEQQDLGIRLNQIGAKTDRAGKVHFDTFGYDLAIRSHFWTHWSPLRKSLRTWVADTVAMPGLEEGDRKELVSRFTDLCLQPRYRDALPDFVRQCTEDASNNVRMSAAYQALRQGLEHEEHGRFFRTRLLDWAKEAAPPKGLSQVMVVACWQVMAVRHPDQAIVRLHHLARREGETTHARDTLTRLVNLDTQFRLLILKRAAQGLITETSPWHRFDADLFQEFADPTAFTIAEPGRRSPLVYRSVRAGLADGWHGVFLRCPHEVWRERAEHWIETAFEVAAHRDALFDVLVGGGRGRVDLLAPVYALARNLAFRTPGDTGRHVALLRKKINLALGLQAA
ncbi:hypothetical protein [Nonomuraea longicatena]|uniref:ATP-binding protein n=1 Tax=Nonomuraea longicatena TaxID=83682 RepID=A0ABN1PGH5_9ACTN